MTDTLATIGLFKPGLPPQPAAGRFLCFDSEGREYLMMHNRFGWQALRFDAAGFAKVTMGSPDIVTHAELLPGRREEGESG